MATFGAFINLTEQDPEAGLRRSILESVLVGHQLKYAYGKAEYDQYPRIARELANTVPTPDIFLASCWPSMDALKQNTGKGIIFTGLSDTPDDGDYNDTPRITGLKGFAATKLCRHWLDLLTQINSSITRVAVIYDQDQAHKSMQAQYDEIAKYKAPLISLQTLHADDPNPDPMRRRPVNDLNIKREIADFAQDSNPAGLIVTAGTRNMLLRKHIIDAVNEVNSTTPKLFTIYPASLFVNSGGLMSYGPDLSELYQLAAQRLKVLIESNIPLGEFQTRFPIIENQDFELVVSGSAASRLNINIPSMFTVTIDGTSQQIKPKIV
jgi:hypothetical protein